MSKYLTPIAVIIAGLAIAGAVLFNGMRSTTVAQQGTQPAAPAVDIKKVKIDGEPFIGKADAKVTMALWSDYQCPFCKAVEIGGVPQIPTAPAIPTLIKDYVDTGKLKIVFKDYPFLGQDSIAGALYERAVWDTYPDKFYIWRDAMYKAQDEEGDQGFGDERSITALNRKLGFDADKLSALVVQNKEKYTKEMTDDRNEGAAMGVNGTPGFIIGKTLIAGAESLDKFKTLIDAELKK